MRRSFLAVLLVLVLPILAFAWKDSFIRTPPEPRLYYPITETVILTGDYLEFKWQKNTDAWLDHYEFRLYKGSNMYADNLIVKENPDWGVDTMQVKADMFEDGGVYTWSLKEVSNGDTKGDRSFQTFKVTKK